jgi:hypothetical protein
MQQQPTYEIYAMRLEDKDIMFGGVGLKKRKFNLFSKNHMIMNV